MMNDINRMIFLAVMGVLSLVLQVNHISLFGAVPNLIISLFAASVVFFVYKDKFLIHLAPALVVLGAGWYWAGFWFIEILAAIVLPISGSLFAQLKTKNFLIDVSILALVSTLLFYLILGLFGSVSFGFFVFLEALYSILLGVLWYLILRAGDNFIESI